jgi:hypothetical protein
VSSKDLYGCRKRKGPPRVREDPDQGARRSAAFCDDLSPRGRSGGRSGLHFHAAHFGPTGTVYAEGPTVAKSRQLGGV